MIRLLLDKKMIMGTLDTLKANGGIITKYNDSNFRNSKKYSSVYEDGGNLTNTIISVNGSILCCGTVKDDIISNHPAAIYIDYTNDQKESLSINIRSKSNIYFTEIERENIIRIIKGISISTFDDTQKVADLISDMKQYNAIIDQIIINENLSLFNSVEFHTSFSPCRISDIGQVHAPERYTIVKSEIDYDNMILNKYYDSIEDSQESYKNICKIPFNMSIYSEIDDSSIPRFYYEYKVNIKLFKPRNENINMYNENYMKYIVNDYPIYGSNKYCWENIKYLPTEDIEIIVNKSKNM